MHFPSTRTSRFAIVVLLLSAFALLVGACGSQDSSMDSPRTSTRDFPYFNADATVPASADEPDDASNRYYRYATDESGADEVTESWHAAMQEIEHRMGRDLSRPD